MRRAPAILLPAVVLALGALGCGGRSGAGGLSLRNLRSRFIGPTPSEQVAMAFDTDDPDRRREGIVLLSKHDWGLAEPYLKGYAAQLRSDENPLVRSVAARALGRAGDPKYFPDLVAALSDESKTVRWDAAVALDGLIPAARRQPDVLATAVGPLQTHATRDPAVDVRAAAAVALRHFGTKDVVRTLLLCLSDPRMGVRYRAHASLVEIAGLDFGYEPEDWASVVDGELPAPLPDEPAKRWWDPRRFRRAKPPAGTQPTSSRHIGTATKPWWDWLGVTEKPGATTQPATAPAGP